MSKKNEVWCPYSRLGNTTNSKMDPKNSATEATLEEKKKEKEDCDIENIRNYCMYMHMKKNHQTFDEYDEAEAAACERYMYENHLFDDE